MLKKVKQIADSRNSHKQGVKDVQQFFLAGKGRLSSEQANAIKRDLQVGLLDGLEGLDNMMWNLFFLNTKLCEAVKYVNLKGNYQHLTSVSYASCLLTSSSFTGCSRKCWFVQRNAHRVGPRPGRQHFYDHHATILWSIKMQFFLSFWKQSPLLRSSANYHYASYYELWLLWFSPKLSWFSSGMAVITYVCLWLGL